MNARTAPVTVPPVTLTKATYNLLLAVLDTEEHEYGHNSRIDDARKWLHYRWLLAQSHQDAAELAKDWPSLESVPDGVDIFPHLPIAGDCHP